MMYRHTIVLWTDDDTRGTLVDWRAESVDGPETVVVADNIELHGAHIWVARQLSTMITIALLGGPLRAADRVRELTAQVPEDPTLF